MEITTHGDPLKNGCVTLLSQPRAGNKYFNKENLELRWEPDDGSNAESGSSNPVTKSEPRQWKKGK